LRRIIIRNKPPPLAGSRHTIIVEAGKNKNMVEEKNKKRKIFQLSLVILVLLVVVALSLGLRSNEKVKADYSSAVCPTGDVVISANTVWDDTAYMLNGSNFEIHCKNITINAGRTLTVPPKTTATKASLSGRKLVIDNNLTVNGTLVLDGGGKTTASNGFGLELYVTGNVTVAYSGMISADGKGYDATKGPGGNTHAAYGGEGHAADSSGSKIIYGSASDPIDLGSGGNPGSGGGMIKIISNGTITNNGAIQANAAAGYGSGGSVNLSANIITGSASSTISAVSLYFSGGGRIAMKYSSSNTFAGTITAHGGNYVNGGDGGAGTIFYSKNDGTDKELVIANDDQYYGVSFDAYDSHIGKTKIESNTYKNIRIEKRSNVYTNSASVITVAGGTFEINNSKFVNSGQINSGSPAGNLLAKNAARFFNAGTGINMPNSNVTFDEKNTYFENQNNLVQYLGNLGITNGAVMSHRVNNDITCQGITGGNRCTQITDSNGTHYEQHYTLRLHTSNVLIDSLSQINVEAKGYYGLPTGGGTGYGPGGGGVYSYDGLPAGYGGEGGDGNSNDDFGRSYGSAIDPNDLGSGGGPGYAGPDLFDMAPGGGLIRIINDGDFTNNGIINANGYAFDGTGRGISSGGGIKIESNRILGAGSITAFVTSTAYAGTNGAGGGRIALIYSTLKNFYGLVSAKGREAGTGALGSGGAGTVLFAQTPSVGSGTLNNKELIIGNHGVSDAYSIMGVTRLQGADLGTYKNITIKGKTNFVIDSGTTLTLNNENFEINNSQIQNNGQIADSNASDLIIKNGAQFFNTGTGGSPGINFTNSSSKIIFDGTGTYFENQNNVEQKMGNLYVQNGALLTHKSNNDITCNPDAPCTQTTDSNGTHYNQNYTLRISANNALIDSSSSIDVTGKGYAGASGSYGGGQQVGFGPGGGGYNDFYGKPAGYGGQGADGNYTDNYGKPYGLPEDPNDLGSGGSTGNNGSGAAGGGLIRMNIADTFTLDGNLVANGYKNVLTRGSGSGGGIKVSAEKILGSGGISASNPGGAELNYSNGSGGGRVALISTGGLNFKKEQINVLGRAGGSASFFAGQNGTIHINGVTSGATLPMPSSLTPTPFDYSSLPANDISYIKADSISGDTTIDEGQAFSGEYTPDQYTTFLMHMNGDNGSCNFIDSSDKGKPISVYNCPTKAQTSTANSKFGGSSGSFVSDDLSGNTGERLIVGNAGDSDLSFGTGAFTIDTWIKPDSSDPYFSPDYLYKMIWGYGVTTDPGPYIAIRYDSPGFYKLSYYNNGSTYLYSTALANDNLWHHIAVSRDNSGISRMFFDGVKVAEGADSFNYTIGGQHFIGKDNYYGSVGHGHPTYKFSGYIDEFRVSKGIARWTSDFDINNPNSFIPQAGGVNLNLKAIRQSPPSGTIDDTFNGTADIYLTDSLAGQYVFSGCGGASCQSFSDHVTATFASGVANLNVRIKDVRTGEVKHHDFSSFRFITDSVGYLNDNLTAGVTELQDKSPERPISPANITVGSKIFKGGAGFSITMNDRGSAQYQQDLGGYLVVRGPIGGAYSFNPDRKTMYKVGDVPSTGYKVICVELANYSETKKCNDNSGTLPAGSYTYGFYTFNKTYNFYTQNEASNYSSVALPSPVTIPSGTVEPNNVTGFTVTPGGGKITLAWINPADNIGQTKTLVVRRKNIIGDLTGPAFVPVDGTDYNDGSATGLANENIVYDNTNVGGSSANISFDDTDLIYGTNYCYDIYTQFIGLNYPPAGAPASVCAVPIPLTNPVSSFTAAVNGMQVSLNWTAPNPSASLAKYLVVRKAGSIPDFTPLNGTDYITPTLTPYKLNLGSGNFLVYDGNSNSFDDGHVDGIQYYYKVFVQYDFGSGPVYSSGVSSAGVTPVAGNVIGFMVDSTPPPGPTYNVLITSINPPSPSYGLTKYLIVREIGAGCSISFTPTANTDYSVGASGVPNENIFLAQSSLPSLPYTDSIGVAAGTEVCYKAFVQYNGEVGGVVDPHLVYSGGAVAHITPPNHPPQIQILNIAQQTGSEKVVVQYRVLDADIDSVGAQFTLNSPCAGVSIGSAGPISATNNWSSTQTFNWNPAGGSCPNVETSSANISVKITDSFGDFNSDNKNFLLDTKAPDLPLTPSDFNLVTVSKTNNSITIQVGANPASDTNPIIGDYVFKMYYAAGATVDTNGTLISIPSDAPFNDYAIAKTKTFTVSGLISGQQYTFNIWMYDNYGHKTSAPLALQETTRGLPPDGFQGISQGMRGHLSWTPPTVPPASYLLIRKKGAIASTWIPSDGSSYPSGYIIASDERVVYSGASISFNDDDVDDVMYTYTLFSNYAVNQYSTGVSASLTPNPINVSNLVPSYVPNGSDYDIGLAWDPPNPNYSFQKYIVAREIGDDCSIQWTPEKNTDYSSTGAISGFPNEYWVYIGSSNSFVDPIAVSAGTKVCYAVFVQYDGEDISNLVYSTGIPLSLAPPNVPPQINTNVSAIQSYGSDQVTINYEVKDSDSTQLDMTFSIVNPNSPSCNLSLADHLTGINNSYSSHSIIWTAASGNGLSGDCPGFELNGAVIRVTTNDSLNSVSQDSAPFELDTRAPALPTPNSDFNLTNFSTAGSSISFNLGLQSTTDANPKSGANGVYKIYYSLGSSTDETTGTLLNGSGFNTYDALTIYSVSGLDAGSQYAFNIWMYDNYGHKTSAGVALFSTGVDPASSFTATSAGMRIILNWSPPVSSTPDGYVILRRSGSPPTTDSLPDGSGPYSAGDLVNGDLVVYSGDGVGANAPPVNDDDVNDTTYYYKIFAHHNSGRYSAPLSANATAVAEDVTGYNATSTNTKVTLFSSAPTDTTNIHEYLTWKIANSDCAGAWTPTDGVAYTESQSIGGGDIIKIQVTPLNNYDDTSISVGTQYCYKTFVRYDGESGSIIYSGGTELAVTPPNNPPQVRILSVVQTPDTEDVVISYQVRDKDDDPVDITFQMDSPCNGNLIGTVLALPAADAWSATQTFNWSSAGDVCADQESDVATVKASITDGFDTTWAFSPATTFDTKAPTTIPSLPTSAFNLIFASKTNDSITVKLSSNDLFSNPMLLDQHPKGGGETYKIYYDLGNTVSDTTGTLLASFDGYELAKEYTATTLLDDQSYAFNIWAYDGFGHKWNAPNALVINTSSGNVAPDVDFTSQPLQQLGSDNVNFGFHFRDQDSDDLAISLSLVNAPGGCTISDVTGFSSPINSSPTWTGIDAIWNASLDCGGQELALLDNLKIEISVDDGNGHVVNATSDAFALDTKAPSIAPGDLSVSLGAAAANETNITLSSTAGNDQNTLAWKVYRILGGVFPVDPSILTPLQSYGTYPGVTTIGDTGLNSDSDYTYNICLFDSYAHFTCAAPQTIHTEAASLSFAIAGVSSGQLVGPETTTVDTTTLPISFGDTALGNTQVAALSLQGGSNLSRGYTINVKQDSDLTLGSNVISAYSGSNIDPLLWPSSSSSSILGYSSLNISRFLSGTKWAGFTTSLDPVVTRNTSGNFSDDFLIKLLVGNTQPPGNYANTITFSILANP